MRNSRKSLLIIVHLAQKSQLPTKERLAWRLQKPEVYGELMRGREKLVDSP